MSERKNAGGAIDTPWGEASELRERRLYPGAGTPPEEVARNQRRALLRVADQLSFELGYTGDDQIPGEHSGLGGEGGAMAGILNSEDELLVAEIRRGLAKVAAAALDGGEQEGANESAVGAALDGAEMVMRGEMVMGNAGRLPALLPGFVFLVTLPVVDQGRALQLSRRTKELLAQAAKG